LKIYLEKPIDFSTCFNQKQKHRVEAGNSNLPVVSPNKFASRFFVPVQYFATHHPGKGIAAVVAQYPLSRN
jgi:hypothetical protein